MIGTRYFFRNRRPYFSCFIPREHLPEDKGRLTKQTTNIKGFFIVLVLLVISDYCEKIPETELPHGGPVTSPQEAVDNSDGLWGPTQRLRRGSHQTFSSPKY